MKINQAKGTQKCVTKLKIKCQDYRNCPEAVRIENKINYLEKINLMKIVLKKIKQNLQKIN